MYTLRFKDHGGNVYLVTEVDAECDEAALSTAHELDVPGIGNGFELWMEERLVHVHPTQG